VQALHYGRLSIARWLITHDAKYVNVIDTAAFQDACCRNHYDVVVWMVTVSTIDVYADDELAFYNACINNHYHIANWLLTTYPSINIYAANCRAFNACCRDASTRIDIILWLCQYTNDAAIRYYWTGDVGYIVSDTGDAIWRHVYYDDTYHIHYECIEDLPSILSHQLNLQQINHTKSARSNR
jgi:hypothetical protein